MEKEKCCSYCCTYCFNYVLCFSFPQKIWLAGSSFYRVRIRKKGLQMRHRIFGTSLSCSEQEWKGRKFQIFMWSFLFREHRKIRLTPIGNQNHSQISYSTALHKHSHRYFSMPRNILLLLFFTPFFFYAFYWSPWEKVRCDVWV